MFWFSTLRVDSGSKFNYYKLVLLKEQNCKLSVVFKTIGKN